MYITQSLPALYNVLVNVNLKKLTTINYITHGLNQVCFDWTVNEAPNIHCGPILYDNVLEWPFPREQHPVHVEHCPKCHEKPKMQKISSKWNVKSL